MPAPSRRPVATRLPSISSRMHWCTPWSVGWSPWSSWRNRAWDPGLGNLWVYFDSEGCIDWAGVVDPTLRVLPDDPDRDRQQVVVFPGEDALAAWTAHRCHRALTPLFTRLSNVSSGAMEIGQMWQLVGSTVVGAATHVPLLARSSETDGMRRGQAILDRFMTLGLPVRHKALAI